MLVVDRNSVDYFYAVIEDGFDPSKLLEESEKRLGVNSEVGSCPAQVLRQARAKG
jgi:hypothetical protein